MVNKVKGQRLKGKSTRIGVSTPLVPLGARCHPPIGPQKRGTLPKVTRGIHLTRHAYRDPENVNCKILPRVSLYL